MVLSPTMWKFSRLLLTIPFRRIRGQSAHLSSKWGDPSPLTGCRDPVSTFPNPISKVFIKWVIVRNEDYLLSATRKHFHDLIGRYGQSIYAINLMKVQFSLIPDKIKSPSIKRALKRISLSSLVHQQKRLAWKQPNPLHWNRYEVQLKTRQKYFHQ